MRPHETVSYRKAFPRGGTAEFLAIDDHFVAQRVSLSAWRSGARDRDSVIFEKAAQAYRQVGLVQHEKKRKRQLSCGTSLGADVDGLAGVVSAPRHRVGVLCTLTTEIVRRGTCAPKILASLLGLWVHVLMFRRPVLCILNEAFKDAQASPAHVIRQLQRATLNELLSLTDLAPALQADLRVDYLPQIFCMDASPTGSGICAAAPSHVVAELWRHSEQEGYYTKLADAASACLQEHGLSLDLPVEMVDPPPPAFGACIPQSLHEGVLFDVVELFCGEGHWIQAHVEQGLTAHPCFGNAGSRLRFTDLDDKSIFGELLGLACRRVVREWHAGPPCLTFGTLRRPRLRSKAQPAGFKVTDPLTALHSRLARLVAFLFCIVVWLGGYVSVEQPGGSVMFYLHCYRVLAELGCVLTRMCSCSYGSPFMKPLQWLHNEPWMLQLGGTCTCPYRGKHLKVEGSFTADKLRTFAERCVPSVEAVFGRRPRLGEAVARFSGSYPRPLREQMAAGCAAAKDGPSRAMPLSARFDAGRIVFV